MTANPRASLFEDFNLPKKPPEEPTPSEPTFSVADLAAARLEAWNDGYLTAAAANATNLQRDGQTVFAELLARSDDIDKGLGLMAEQNAALIARWLVDTFVAAFPELANQPLAGRRRAVMDVLHSALRSQSKIEVRGERKPSISFHTMHDVCRQIEAQQIEDPSDSSIIIAWQQGEAQIDPSRTWEDIRQAIMPLAAADDAGQRGFQILLAQREAIRHVG